MAKRKRTLTHELRTLLKELGWQNFRFRSGITSRAALVVVASMYEFYLYWSNDKEISYEIRHLFMGKIVKTTFHAASNLRQACEKIKKYIMEYEETRFNTIRDSMDS